jgi:LysR family transcriptional regulator of gallate degradation
MKLGANNPSAVAIDAVPPAGMKRDWHPPDLPQVQIEPNMRRLRAFVAVSQCRSVNRAARQLHLTQSAVTRAVRALEAALGIKLFERSTRGMAPTECGHILFARASRALAYLDEAEQELAAARPPSDGRRRVCGLVAKVAHRHLQAVIGVADFQTETAAALQLGLSQPAVTLALRDFERILGASLFQRSSRGMLLNVFGEIVVRRAKLALAEIAAAADDIAARVGLLRGRLVLGVLPLSGTLLPPRAISRMAREHPDVQLTLIEAPYDTLVRGLRCGDIDLIVGALHDAPAPDLRQEKLLDDALSVVVRRGHPLTARASLTLADTADAEWVVPYRRTAWRNMFERAMLAAGLSLPDNAIEANTMVMVRGLLMESDRLSVLSRRQIFHDEGCGLLSVLPIDLRRHALPIGITTRADAMSSAGLEALVSHLRRAIVEPVAAAPSRALRSEAVAI